jgi:hypothetical protein
MIDPADALRTLEHFITAERGMREHVFRANPAKMRSKVAACDKALQAVESLRKTIAHDEQGELEL